MLRSTTRTGSPKASTSSRRTRRRTARPTATTSASGRRAGPPGRITCTRPPWAWDCRQAFSEVVLEAKALGYTEPDPRDDLSGMDVARKLIILAREMGLRTELAEVRVESLVPSALGGCGIDEFVERLPEFDATMLAR